MAISFMLAPTRRVYKSNVSASYRPNGGVTDGIVVYDLEVDPQSHDGLFCRKD